MRHTLFFACALVTASAFLLRCSSSSTSQSGNDRHDASSDSGTSGNAGEKSDGAASGGSGSGGTTNSGGTTGSGGANASDARAADGSASGTPNDAAVDSSMSDAAASGGSGSAGTGGNSGTGGAGTGGNSGTGGAGTGGNSGTGGAGTGGAGTGGSSGTGGTTTGDSGVDPHLGEVRFVNVAPDAPALDVCVKLTGALNYTDAPVFHALGKTTGVSFGQISDYVDLGFDPAKYYDFVFVGAASGTCAPPWYGAIGVRSFAATVSTTIAIYQYSFAVAAYNGAQITDLGAATAGKANVRFMSATQTPATDDVYGTPNGGAETEWFSNVAFQTGTAFHATSAGTYKLRVTSGGTATTLAQKTSIALASDSSLDVLLYPSDQTHYALMRCPSTQSVLVGPCAQ